MRATLEQLKTMSEPQLMSMWIKCQFPFDAAMGCCSCITVHRGAGQCQVTEHSGLIAEAKALGKYGAVRETIVGRLEELYALRLFYDSLYPQTVEAAEEKAITELAPSLVTQG